MTCKNATTHVAVHPDLCTHTQFSKAGMWLNAQIFKILTFLRNSANDFSCSAWFFSGRNCATETIVGLRPPNGPMWPWPSQSSMSYCIKNKLMLFWAHNIKTRMVPNVFIHPWGDNRLLNSARALWHIRCALIERHYSLPRFISETMSLFLYSQARGENCHTPLTYIKWNEAHRYALCLREKLVFITKIKYVVYKLYTSSVCPHKRTGGTAGRLWVTLLQHYLSEIGNLSRLEKIALCCIMPYNTSCNQYPSHSALYCTWCEIKWNRNSGNNACPYLPQD